jgi:hypothetical protein
MGKIFNKKKKEEVVMASPPKGLETPGEIKETERLNNQDVVEEAKKEVTKTNEVEYRGVPVCMSRSELDNMNIETNMIVKQILSNMND